MGFISDNMSYDLFKVKTRRRGDGNAEISVGS